MAIRREARYVTYRKGRKRGRSRFRKRGLKRRFNKLRRQVNRMIEKKYIDFLADETAFGFDLGGGSAFPDNTLDVLAPITQGVTNATRAGDKLTLRWLKLNFEVGTSGGQETQYRIVVFQDRKQQSGYKPLDTDLFVTGGTNRCSLQQYKTINLGRWDILYDQMGHLDANDMRVFNFSYAWPRGSKSAQVQYNPGAATLIKNGLYICVTSTYDTASSACFIRMRGKLCFVDP